MDVRVSVFEHKAFVNLWHIKQKIQETIIEEVSATEEDVHIIDGFPMPICHFRRANRSKLFADVEEATFGHCASKNETYYGFEGHVVISGSGFITGYTLTKPNVEREASFECMTGISGLLLGDKGYSGEHYHREMIERNIQVSVPPKKNQIDEKAPLFRRYLNKTRRRVETVIGQLTERFSISKIWSRDTWHLTNRIARKILSHTMAMLLLREQGNHSMAIDEILTC